MIIADIYRFVTAPFLVNMSDFGGGEDFSAYYKMWTEIFATMAEKKGGKSPWRYILTTAQQQECMMSV